MACTENSLIRAVHIIMPTRYIRNKQDVISSLGLKKFDFSKINDALVNELTRLGSQVLGLIYNISHFTQNACLKQIIEEAFNKSVTQGLTHISHSSAAEPVRTALDIGVLPVIRGENQYLLDEPRLVDFFLKRTKEIPEYETRPEQLEMMQSVVKSINDKKFLIVEAGTGVGKSIAYLLPVVIWSLVNDGERVVVSTNTKNLQDQLIKKDIPIIRKILGQDFLFTHLKGRSNYLCRRRFNNYLEGVDWKSGAKASALINLIVWLSGTKSGEMDENSGFSQEFNGFSGVKDDIISKSHYCLNRDCRFYNECFVYNARNLARKSKVLVVNHSLLFSDLDRAVLPDFNTVVLDEAHKIEDRATDALSIEFSHRALSRVMRRLYRINDYNRKEGGLLIRVYFKIKNVRDSIKEETASSIMRKAKDLNSKITIFLDEVMHYLREYGSSVFQDGKMASDTRKRLKKIYAPGIDQTKNFKDGFDKIGLSLKDILSSLKDLSDLLERVPEHIVSEIETFKVDISGAREEITELYGNYKFIFKEMDEDYVYWIEKFGKENYAIFAAPIDISNILQERFYPRLSTAVLCSATLAVGGSFDFFYQGIGLTSVINKSEKILGSPFNYRENVKVGIPDFIPSPKSEEFVPAATRLLEHVAQKYQGRTLVLFTNTSFMAGVRKDLRSLHLPVEVIAQKIDGANYALIEEFKQRSNVILLGVDSYWEGIDIPGNALSYLVITRLPFGRPSDPIIQAKRELCESKGLNPFRDFDLPHAVIRLKQGFGRLIRRKNDKGVVLIFDRRIINARYGKSFWQSLPELQKEVLKSANEFDAFLEDSTHIHQDLKCGVTDK